MSIADRPHWVYEFIAADGSHLYVGCTCNLPQRISSHRAKPWWSDVQRIEVDTYPDQASALAAERDRIELYQPTHNVVFTDVVDERRQARLERQAAVHETGGQCGYASCRLCADRAHEARHGCASGCRVCEAFVPYKVLIDQQEFDCWQEIARRHSPYYATQMLYSTNFMADALIFDEAGISLDEINSSFGEPYSYAFEDLLERAKRVHFRFTAQEQSTERAS